MSWYIPDTTFYMHEYEEGAIGGCTLDGVPPFEWKIQRAQDIFAGKKIVLFALPGAFTPTCSAAQLPGFEKLAPQFKQLGVDDIYCTAVNDAFVMRSWEVDQMLKNVKMLPDGNGDFAEGMGMLVDKRNLGFGKRSWRYAAVIDDMKIVKLFAENHWSEDLYPVDPFEVSSAENVLEWLKNPTDLQVELDFDGC